MPEERFVCHRCGSERTEAGQERCPRCNLHLVAESEHRKNPRDALLGTTLGGKYHIVGIIGAGGMGAVYRSVQPLVDRPVAIKVILGGGAFQGQDARKRFLLEAKTIAHLDHPAVVTLYDFGAEEDGLLYMVQELIQGTTLASMFRAGGMTVRQVVEIALSVLDALAAAHEDGIIHRDLKPENIMLAQAKGSGRAKVKVLDFGLAKLIGGSASRLTRSGTVYGTPHYMSPEQGAARAIDHRTDLYALGCLLFEALAGRVPFDAPHPLALLATKVNEEPPHLPALPHVPSGLDEVLQKALARNPDNRHGTARRMAEALSRVSLGAESDLPLPPSVAPGWDEDRLASFEAREGIARRPEGVGKASGPPAGRQTLLDSAVHQPLEAVHLAKAPTLLEAPPPPGEAETTAHEGESDPYHPRTQALKKTSSSSAPDPCLGGEARPSAPMAAGQPSIQAAPSSPPQQVLQPPGMNAGRAKRRALGLFASLAFVAAGLGLVLLWNRTTTEPAALGGTTSRPMSSLSTTGLVPPPLQARGGSIGSSATPALDGVRPSPEPAIAPLADNAATGTNAPPAVAATGREAPPALALQSAALLPASGPAPSVDIANTHGAGSGVPVSGSGETGPAKSRHVIESDPYGATVYGPHNKKLGVTPLEVEQKVIPGKEVRYRIKLKGFSDSVITLPLDGTERVEKVALGKAGPAPKRPPARPARPADDAPYFPDPWKPQEKK